MIQRIDGGRQKEVRQKEADSGSFICLKDEVILIK